MSSEAPRAPGEDYVARYSDAPVRHSMLSHQVASLSAWWP